MALRTTHFAASLWALVTASALVGCMTVPPAPPAPPTVPTPTALRLSEVGFADLDGWAGGDLRAALLAFQRSCSDLGRKPDDAPMGGVQYAGSAGDWRSACNEAARLTAPQSEDARRFFEANFVPYRVAQGTAPGLFTGYYEPELRGSRTRQGPFQTPLYGVPQDLVTVDLGLFRDTFKGQRLAGRVVMGRLEPYPARAEIVRAGLPRDTPLFYVDDPVDAFFLQIQGSGRIALDDGSVVRAVYAAQNGQPYTAIGAILVARGEMTREEVSLQSIRAWMLAHPGEAEGLMNANASYVFFAERAIGNPEEGAPGSEGVPLTPEASLAVDTRIHPLGVPVWLDTVAPDPDASRPDRPFRRLLIMQDTGGAIRGAQRGDVYWGFGPGAAEIAGRMRSEGRLSVLLPKGVAQRLGSGASYAAPP